MIDFYKRLKTTIPTPFGLILNDQGLQPEGYTPTKSNGDRGDIIIFSGYWSYYVADLNKIIRENSSDRKLYLDVGRGYYLTLSQVEKSLKHLGF